jgi:hypothetical protein
MTMRPEMDATMSTMRVSIGSLPSNSPVVHTQQVPEEVYLKRVLDAIKRV